MSAARLMLACAALFLAPPLLAAAAPIDPAAALDELTDRSRLPRLVTTDDLNLPANAPEALFSPTGDFNGDGAPDIALSGVYDLTPSASRYFLLVASRFSNPVRYRRLYYAEYDRPAHLHPPGTTGAGDRGDELFSVSFCANCSDGFDVYPARDGGLRLKPWEAVRVGERTAIAPPTDAQIDAALKAAAALPDVDAYVKAVRKRKGSLGSRVERADGGENRMAVTIFERKGNEDAVYDVITVDVTTGAIVSRKRTPTTGRGTSR